MENMKMENMEIENPMVTSASNLNNFDANLTEGWRESFSAIMAEIVVPELKRLMARGYRPHKLRFLNGAIVMYNEIGGSYVAATVGISISSSEEHEILTKWGWKKDPNFEGYIYDMAEAMAAEKKAAEAEKQ